MNINKLIKDTLKPLNIPTSFQKYTGKANTYITFFLYNENGELFANNAEIATNYFVQIDIWSNEDYSEIVENVMNAIKEVGFKRTSSADLYEYKSETETVLYHKALRFNYTV